MVPPTLKYQVIAQAIRDWIDAGQFSPGDYLPAESDLAKQFAASPGTVRRALQVLVEEGTLSAQRGAKKIVLRQPRAVPAAKSFRSFAQWAYSQGKTPSGQVLEQQWVPATAEDVRLLGVAPEDSVLAVFRLRALDGQAVMAETTRYPRHLGEIVAQLDPHLASVTNVLAQEHDIRFVAADNIFDVAQATDREAAALGIASGSAVLLHHRLSRGRFGNPLEYSRDAYLPGVVRLAVTTTELSNVLNWVPAPSPS